MADNQETSPASSLDQLTQAAGQLGQLHSNAVVPHKIANHDMLVQTSIWGGSDVGWINLNDTQDQLNTRMDLHKVEKAVQAQVTTIEDTVKRANDAVDQANKAIDSSNVNKVAIDAANSAIAEAKQSASDAVQKLQSVESSVNTTSDEVTKVKQSQADQIKQVTNQISDAVTQAKAAADSLDAKTTALQTAVKNAQSDATVATQTASEANLTAINAASDAATAKITASGAAVTAINAQSDVIAIQATASEATITAGNAASDALTAKATASSANLTATNAKNDVAQISATADSLSTRVTAVESKATANSTAIDENTKAITLKADQKTVDTLNKTVTDNSAAVNVLNGEITSKVDSTTVNEMIDGKGFATTNTVQSMITQSAGNINETITNLDTEFKSGMENSVQLVRKSDFEDGDIGNWNAQSVVVATNPAPPAELGQAGMKVLQTNTRDSYEDGIWYSVKPGEKFDVDFWCVPSPAFHTTFGLVFYDKNKQVLNWLGIQTDQPGQWKHYTGTITAPANAAFAKPWFQMEKPADNTTDTALLAKPSIRRQNATTVAAIQQITVSIDGLQSNVANKADKSQITQLSNVIQSKVNSSDYNSKVSQLSNDINLRVAKGDLISQINLEAGGDGLISVQNSKGKLMLDADSVVFGNKAFIPSAAITNIQADKITSGTLDAGNIRVINLTADNIHGGTLDVGNMHVKNFSANDIEAGTLSGVTIRAGDTTDFFQTSQDNIYWITDNGDQSAVIGKGRYVTFPGLNIFDSHALYLGTWGGADLENGTIEDNAGSTGHPKFNIELHTDSAFDLDSEYGDMGSTGGVPLDNNRISGWVGQREYFYLEQTQGFHVDLNPDINTSQFRIQKDDHFGAYFGEGNNSNQINLVAPVGGVNVTGNFHVTGSKNSIVNTKQGYLAINAYETAEYYFGDIGEDNTGNAGQVVIGIDRIFNETVNTDITYQVFVTPYSDAHVWVKGRYNNRFVVCSDKPNAEFGWELKAKRKGYESNRLRRVSVDVNPLQLKGETK